MSDELQTGIAKIEADDDRFSVRELMRPETQQSIQRMAEDAVGCMAFVPEKMTAVEAAVVIRAGLEIGLPPMAALKTVYLVHGKAGIESKAMLALLRRRPDLGYYLWGECNDKQAEIIMHVRTPDGKYAEQPYVFTMEAAQKAGLLSSQMYKKWPEVMLRNRVAAIAMRSSFPDLLLGCAYTPDEIGVPVYVEGQQVVVDEDALARGEVLELDDGGRGAAEVEAGLGADEEGDVDFDTPGGGGSKLEEPPVDPEQVKRDEMREYMAGAMDELYPPDDLPDWAEEQPDTLGQLAALCKQITLKMDGNMGRALVAHADAGSHAETWDLIVVWWLKGLLPGHVFAALCEMHEVAPEPNPFPMGEEDADAPDEEEDPYAGLDE